MNELYHSGVRGQKHGIRQYQNLDGTWTELGKMRRRIGASVPRGSSSNKEQPLHKKIANVGNSVKEYGTFITRERPVDYRDYIEEMKTLSDAELQRRVNRMNIENNYMRLTDARVNFAKRKGAEIVKDIVVSIGTTVGIAGGVMSIVKAVK